MYETEADRKNERQLADRVSGLWGARFMKLPISYNLDYALVYGETILAWIEMKRRFCTRDKYPTLLLDLQKWHAGIDLYDRTARPFILLIQWDDGDFYYDYDPLSIPKLRYGGRTVKTRDAYDIEPVVHIPVSEFRRIVGPRGTRIPKRLRINLSKVKKAEAAGLTMVPASNTAPVIPQVLPAPVLAPLSKPKV